MGGPCGFFRRRREAGSAAEELGVRLRGDAKLMEQLRESLRVGVHWETAVQGCDHKVCQVFCSALPVTFATAALEAAYEATLACGALLARRRGARVRVYLT